MEKEEFSLIGRINVVNTLVVSVFVYKMTVLPKIPEKMILQLNKIIKDFIWNGAKRKIPLRILQQSVENNGLKLTDFEAKDDALKAGWVRTIQLDPRCGDIAHEILHPSLKEVIWACNLCYAQVESIVQTKDSFWTDALKAWCKFSYDQNQQLCSQPIIWANSKLLIEGKPFFWKEPFDRGLITVNQLMENGGWITSVQAQNKFGLNFLQFAAIRAAIPKEWKLEMQNNTGPITNTTDEDVYVAKFHLAKSNVNLTKEVYSKLMDAKHNDVYIDNKVSKWSKELVLTFQDICISDSYRNIKASTCVIKYRSFQYRLANRAIVTNIQLKHWGKADTDLCLFCMENRETVSHLFISCDCVQPMWERALCFISDSGFDIASPDQIEMLFGSN